MTPWTVAFEVPLSTRFSRQEYWGGLPFPSPGGLPNPEIEPRSPTLQAGSLPFKLSRETQFIYPRSSELNSNLVKNLPAMQELQELQVESLGQKDPLEEGMATHSSIFAWRISWTEKPEGLWSMGLQRVGHD